MVEPSCAPLLADARTLPSVGCECQSGCCLAYLMPSRARKPLPVSSALMNGYALPAASHARLILTVSTLHPAAVLQHPKQHGHNPLLQACAAAPAPVTWQAGDAWILIQFCTSVSTLVMAINGLCPSRVVQHRRTQPAYDSARDMP